MLSIAETLMKSIIIKFVSVTCSMYMYIHIQYIYFWRYLMKKFTVGLLKVLTRKF